jgi:hypothetical protein
MHRYMCTTLHEMPCRSGYPARDNKSHTRSPFPGSQTTLQKTKTEWVATYSGMRRSVLEYHNGTTAIDENWCAVVLLGGQGIGGLCDFCVCLVVTTVLGKTN